jgi:hypothetical protein
MDASFKVVTLAMIKQTRIILNKCLGRTRNSEEIADAAQKQERKGLPGRRQKKARSETGL